ncbi:MAG: hypothetical protein SGI97_09375 [candidate division Zixibacteria bacterium]|mgnify:CR=1 FL=1|nr:hypothetical protein [candidate division Zixibacteria bacterium]
MLYTITYPEAVLQFTGNAVKAFVDADSSVSAVAKVRESFRFMREETANLIGEGQYLVMFKVVHDYRQSLLRAIDKSVRLLCNQRFYNHARYLDRYIVAIIAFETGKPAWLGESVNDLTEEICALRTAAIVAREVASVDCFVDWDICIFNYIELNFKDGHKSRVMRYL